MIGVGCGVTSVAARARAAVVASGLTFVQPTNLKWRWTGSSPASAVDGASQSTWTDTISGVQGTVPSGSPTYKASAFSGKPGMHFAGSQYFDIGRDPTLLAALQGDHTIMIVTTNFAAGANAIAALFCSGGIGSGNHWMVANVTNAGMYNGQHTTNPMAATDLYVFYYSCRHNGTYLARAIGGINGTSFFSNTTLQSPGTGNFTIGTGRADSVTNGNTYSFRGDILEFCIWNTNLAFVDIVRQVRRFHTYFGKPMPWAGVSTFLLCDGDSITQGINGLVNANYPWFLAGLLGRKYGEWANNGAPGALADPSGGGIKQLSDDFLFQYAGLSGADALGIPVAVTWMEWANQRSSSSSSITAPLAAIDRWAVNIKTAIPNAKSVFLTSTALGGNDGVTGDQTADGALGTNASQQGTNRIAFSEHYRLTPHAQMDAVVSLHLDAAIGQIGSNPFTPDASNLNFGNNNTHPKGIVGQDPANGYARIAALVYATVQPML